MKRIPRRTKVRNAVLLADGIGLGSLFAITVTGWLWLHHANLLISVWLGVNAFAVGWLMFIAAWWAAWDSSRVSRRQRVRSKRLVRV